MVATCAGIKGGMETRPRRRTAAPAFAALGADPDEEISKDSALGSSRVVQCS
jgi:hypothetical protein